MTAPQPTSWFYDYFGDDEAHIHAIKAWLFSGQSPYQRIEVLELGPHGKSLVLDGKIQSSARDEFIYHEALVHPALIAHPDPRRVCIVGGGEGATLREVLRHRTVTEAVMVDIDAEVVAVCRQWLPEWHQGSYDDPRTRLIIQDARAYLEGAEPFDAIFLDVTDPLEQGPSHRLFTQEFYQLVRSRLTEDGVVALQAEETSLGDTLAFTSICHTLKTVFPVVRPYSAAIPSFSVPWGFALASLGADPLLLSPAEVDERLAGRLVGENRFYDGGAHAGLFSLPRYLRLALEEETNVIRDDAPLYVL